MRFHDHDLHVRHEGPGARGCLARVVDLAVGGHIQQGRGWSADAGPRPTPSSAWARACRKPLLRVVISSHWSSGISTPGVSRWPNSRIASGPCTVTLTMVQAMAARKRSLTFSVPARGADRYHGGKAVGVAECCVDRDEAGLRVADHVGAFNAEPIQEVPEPDRQILGAFEGSGLHAAAQCSDDVNGDNRVILSKGRDEHGPSHRGAAVPARADTPRLSRTGAHGWCRNRSPRVVPRRARARLSQRHGRTARRTVHVPRSVRNRPTLAAMSHPLRVIGTIVSHL